MTGKILEVFGYLLIVLSIILSFAGVVDFSASGGKNELVQLGIFFSCLLGAVLVFFGKAACK